MLSQFNNNPAIGHCEAAKRCLRYLLATHDIGLFYPINEDVDDILFRITCDVGASYAACLLTRRSHTGAIWYINGCPVMWHSSRQSIVALSSCEAEYFAICHAVKESKFLRQLLRDFGVETETEATRSITFNDNQSAIQLGLEPALRKRSRHFDTRLHFVQDEVLNQLQTLEWQATGELSADSLTKSLSVEQTLYLRVKYMSG